MSKQILHKRLRLIDWEDNRFCFFEAEVLSVGYNKLTLTLKEGNIGTKGKTTEHRFEGSKEAFNQAMKTAYRHIYDKKNEGYLSVEKLIDGFSKRSAYSAATKKKTTTKQAPTRLVHFDWAEDDVRFYDLELVSIGHNHLHVLTTYGKLGSKGRTQVHQFQGSDHAFTDARNYLQQKTLEKKGQGFITKEQAEHVLLSLSSAEQQEKQAKKQAARAKKNIAFGYDCDKCRKTIEPKMYEKINAWARGEGNWDGTKKHVKKVYCLDCQIDLEVFKKKLPSENN